MAIEKKTQPYEFLARWDNAGNLSGSHIRYREIIQDVETLEIYAEKVGNPLPVTQDGAYPLSDILDEIHKTLLVNFNEVSAEKDAAKSKCDEYAAEIVKLNNEVKKLKLE